MATRRPAAPPSGTRTPQRFPDLIVQAEDEQDLFFPAGHCEGPSPPRPEMAYSVDWVAERMGEMEHLASGIQLADENLGQRPARFVAEANLARLDEVRAAYDPDGRFHTWMGRP